MDNFLFYLLKVAAGTGLLLAIYLLFYRKDTFYVRNRIILVLSVLIPVIVPFLTIPVTVQTAARTFPSIDLLNFSQSSYLTDSAPVSSSQATVFNFLNMFTWIYFTGAVLVIIRGLISILSTYNIIRKGKLISAGFPKVLLSEQQHPPFSFFPYAVIPAEEYNNGNYGDILDHEFAHLRQGHTFDLLLSEIFIAFQWFNPFAWLIKRYMVLNHEYLADQISLSKRSIKDYQYRLLNIAGATTVVALAHTFNSLIKNRIIMINKKPTNRKAAWKILIIIPAILVLLYAFVEPEYEYVVEGNDPLTISEAPVIVQKEVRGVVVNEEGKPLEGVYIASTGTLGDVMYVLSDADGRFKLSNIREDAILILNLRGYASVTRKPDFGNDMKITMSKDGSFVDAKFINPPSGPGDNKPLVVLDGVISDKSTAEIISGLGNEFGTVNLLKGKEATDKYGEKGKNGVEEVYSRKKATELGLKFPFRRISPDEYPTFQGKNFVSFTDWVINSTQYPAEALSKGIQGRVTVTYTVDAEGYVTDVKGQGKADPILLESVIKTVQSSPVWEPAVKENARLPFSHMISLKFVLPGKIMPDDVYVVTEVMPLYPGGDTELLKYLSDNVRYPESAREQKIEGRVILRFIVNTSGDAEEVTVLKGVHPLLDEEAMRVVSLLKGFEPGKQGGVPVNVWYMVPITFSLPEESTEPVQSYKIKSEPGKRPLIVVDGLVTDKDASQFDSKNIQSVNVIKGEQATALYGEKAKDGVIHIITKRESGSTQSSSDIPFVAVENMPEFPGGNEEMLKWISANLKYPEVALQQKIEGKVTVRFVVSSEGKVGEVVVLKSDNQILNEEAIRVISGMPLWKPGSQNGKKVNVYSMVPVEFKMNN